MARMGRHFYSSELTTLALQLVHIYCLTSKSGRKPHNHGFILSTTSPTTYDLYDLLSTIPHLADALIQSALHLSHLYN